MGGRKRRREERKWSRLMRKYGGKRSIGSGREKKGELDL